MSRVHERHPRAAWLCGLALLVSGGCAARQPARSFPDLQKRLHAGNTVYVIDNAGTETKGRIVGVSTSALVLDVKGIQRRMEEGSVRQVQRHGDSLWNGLLIGVGVGASALLISDPTYERCRKDPRNVCANPQTGERVLAVGIMGAAGAGIDALIRGRNDVYLAPRERLRTARAPAASPSLAGSAPIAFVTPDLNNRPVTVCDGARSIVQLVNCLQISSAAKPSIEP